MYGDTEVMRRRVGQLREQGGDIRMLADRLVAQVESLAWTGRAADALHERIHTRASHLRDAASRHDQAADSLEKHLQLVGDLQDSIEQIERKAAVLVAEARGRVAGIEHQASSDAEPAAETGVVVRREADADDLRLATLTPPPSGHQDWLTLEIPGL